MAINTAIAGKTYPTSTYEVTADAIRAYAAATNEDNPAFTGDDPVAPPAFPGRQRVRVVNAARGRAFELDYDPAAFPAFFEWLNLREGSYAVGLEPSTHHVAGDAAAREDGSMIWLAHGEDRTYQTVFRFTRG